MLAEWLLIGLFLGTVLLLARRHSRAFSLWVLGGIAATIASAALWQGHIERVSESLASLQRQIPRQTPYADYIGSESCRACHPAEHKSWHRSYHRTMTQLATPSAVAGNFNRVKLEWKGETFSLERRGDEFWVDMIDPDWRYVRAIEEPNFQTGKTQKAPPPARNPPRVQKRICMVTGSHHMQSYWVPGKYGNQQFNFPFTYLLEAQRWAPRDDVFLKSPHSEKSFQTWNLNCFACHSTGGQPRQDPDSYVLDTQVAEFGISCEACHGPGREHARKNAAPLRRHTSHQHETDDASIVNPARLSSKAASEICGQCHATRENIRKDWFELGARFRPGAEGVLETDAPLLRPEKNPKRTEALLITTNSHSVLQGTFWGDGMIRVSGREYNGLVYSPCYQKGELSCLSCHSMHDNISSDDQLAHRKDGNQACTQCHGKFKENLTAHTRHAPGSSGSQCYNCHMPHTTYGLLKAIRSHQISSPSVQTSLSTGRPNACNLCHLDKSLGWSADHLRQWFGKPAPAMAAEEKTLSAAVVWTLRGDAGQRALIAWHMGWEPAKAVSGANWQAPYLAQLLEDPYAVVRYIAQRSLKRLPGFSRFNYDFVSPREEQLEAHERALKIWKASAPKEQLDTVLLNQGGELQPDYHRLLNQRADHPMDLLE